MLAHLIDHLANLSVPLMRSYIRYFPLATGKRSLWTRIIDPYCAWRSRKFVAPTVFGSEIAGDSMDIIQQYIYYFGVWEPQLTSWIQRRLSPGDTFIDVGANIGYFSLLASKLVGDSGSVVAIEASPKIFGALQNNLGLNKVRNVRSVNMAASDSQGVTHVFHGHECNSGLTSIFDGRDLELECQIESAPLSIILKPQEIENARLIKIDVEGAEWSVAIGMEKLFGSARADLEIIVEIDPIPLAKQGKRPEDLMKIFWEAGFHAYAIENDYSPLSFTRLGSEKRPVRMDKFPNWVTDVVFSRQAAKAL